MGVSKIKGTPKWMVYMGKPYEQMDNLGVFPLFLVQHPYVYLSCPSPQKKQTCHGATVSKYFSPTSRDFGKASNMAGNGF